MEFEMKNGFISPYFPNRNKNLNILTKFVKKEIAAKHILFFFLLLHYSLS
jgi:hypothetical protein